MYRNFWFSNQEILLEDSFSIPKYNALFLRNVRTDISIKKMSADEFIKQDLLLSKLFRHLLDHKEADGF